MTVGQRIQHYRKLQGLSQEELGQKLLVSRQTVSLWENDQTLPTIDNLVRLKEIFGVSVDEILTEQETNEIATMQQPVERYRYTYHAEDLERVHQSMLRPIRKRAYVAVSLTALMGIVIAISDNAPGLAGFLIGLAVLCAIANIRAIKQIRDGWKKSAPRVACGEYLYEVYETCLQITVFENGVIRSVEHVPISAIERIQSHGDIVVIEVWGRMYLLRQEAIGEGTVLFTQRCNMPALRKEKPKRDKWQKWSIVLFVATLLCLHGALGVLSVISDASIAFVKDMWVFFLLLPIPIASIVLGFMLKKKGYKWKKNVIAGCIMAFLLIVYGCFTFIFGGMFDTNDAHIVTIENYTGIDIPQHSRIVTQDWTWGSESETISGMRRSSEIYFEVSDVSDFEVKLSKDGRWNRKVKSELVGLLPSNPVYQQGDYMLLYNVDTGEFNALPPKDGNYTFVSIFYDSVAHKMYIAEYGVVYVS